MRNIRFFTKTGENYVVCQVLSFSFIPNGVFVSYLSGANVKYIKIFNVKSFEFV